MPAGIFTFAFLPSIVGTSTVAPSAASANEIGNSKKRFSSDLLKILWSLIDTKIYKSPFPPPFIPASPLLANLILVPSSTPFGILVYIFFLVCFLPIPLHSLHRLEICSPEPAHSGQVC